MNFTKSILLYGKDEPLPERIELKAGALNMLYENGDLRYIRYGEREIIRRIYVAIRDRNWGTIAPQFSNLKMEIGPDAFRVSYNVVNQQGEIDFAWHGEIRGDASGRLSFSMDGQARSTFWRNRIGFCVLYPAFLSGAECLVEHGDGSRETAPLPTLIVADQPVKPFANLGALTHEVQPGVQARVRFSGDVFEMEDQRNWTDASYKIFCTPLSLPYPAEVKAGTRIQQAIEMDLQAAALSRASAAAGGSAAAEAAAVTLTLGDPAGRLALPPIGLGCASHGRPLSGGELQRLRALTLGHLRVDLDLTGDTYAADLRRAWAEAQSIGASLEAAVLLRPEAEPALASLRALLDELRPALARWLVFAANEKFSQRSPNAEVLALAHRYLDDYAPGTPLCGGTNTDFIFLKRNPLPIEQMDALSFAIVAEVHAFDNLSMVETLEAQTSVVKTGLAFGQGRPVVVSPVTFKMRFNAYATGAPAPLKPGELPPQVDVRQMSLFGAAWTLGSIRALAEAGAASLTFYETSGWRGIQETPNGSPLPDAFHSLPGGVYPMYHVFADVTEFAGGWLLPAHTSDNLSLDGLALVKDGRRRILAANMTAAPQQAVLRGLGPQVSLRRLDESNVLEAMRSPEAFRAAPGEVCATSSGALTVTLPPYGLIRLDE